MDCEQAMTLASAHLDNEIGPEDRENLREHLAGCAECRAALDALSRQDVELRRSFVSCERSAARVAEHVLTRLSHPAASPKPSVRRWGFVAIGALAAACLVVAFVWNRPPSPQSPTPSDPLVPSNPLASIRPIIPPSIEFAPPHQRPLGTMVARPTAEAPAPERLAVGQVLRTKANERRRVALDDGSVLNINQNTMVKVDGLRHVTLSSGDVFVEVAPRSSDANDATFTVRAPGREVHALGTKFAVSAEKSSAGVVVTQGKVRVADAVVYAGQELKPDADEPTIAARASHLLDWTKDLLASAESPLVPGAAQCGGALVAVDPNGQEARLSLRKYHVDVHIEDGFARTTIDQTYFNHLWSRLEGTFYFPLPPDASLSRLAMYVAHGNECVLMEGGMCERDHARNVFETIMYTQRDPALLEWVDGSTFKMRVFPLEGRQEKRIVLSYTQRLETLYGRTSYRFPGGHNMPLVDDWSFHARVRHGAKIDWKCESHELAAKVEDQDLLLDVREKQVKPTADVTLHLHEKTPPSGAKFSLAEHEGHKYLMLRYRPELKAAKKTGQRRDWVFLFENSADRDPVLARAQIEILKSLLKNGEHDDTLSVLTVNTRVRGMTERAVPATPENVARAVEFLDRAHLVGALNLGDGFAVLEQVAAGLKNPWIVHLGSGIATLGDREEAQLLRRLPEKVPYVGVGVGKRWSRSLMKRAAERSGGWFTQINPDEPLPWRAFELLAVLNTPRLQDVKIVDDAEKLTFLSHALTLAQGEELCSVARLDKDAAWPKKISVSATLDGKPFTETISLNDVSWNADYLPRTWAKLEIERLLAGDIEKNKDQIVALSKSMYVMTPFTSLLVLENEAMYEQFKVDRGRKDHWALYDCPPRIPLVYEPDPNQPKDWRANLKDVIALPNADQVRGTIVVRGPLPWFDGRSFWSWTTAQQLRNSGYAWPDHDLERVELDRLLKELDNLIVQQKLISARTVKPGTTMGGKRDGSAKSGNRIIHRETAKSPERPMSRPSQPISPGADWMDGKMRERRGNWDEEDANFSQSFWRRRGRRSWESSSSQSPLVRALQADRRERGLDLLDGLAEAAMSHIHHGRQIHDYYAPAFRRSHRIFADLLARGPGLNTSVSDILATLETEAKAETPRRVGKIDDDARKLIDEARKQGWQSVQATIDGVKWEFTIDGQGRHAWTRRLDENIVEQVVCDGERLWHLYPDIGLAARRMVSRFHRADLAAIAPWLVAPVQDLAIGADVALVGDRTVAVTPHHAEGEQVVQTLLVFAEDGRLAERRSIALPEKNVLTVETFAADGKYTVVDGKDAELVSIQFTIGSAEAPKLIPALDDLVVLDLPLRTPEYFRGKYRRDDKTGENGAFHELDERMDENMAIALLASWSISQHDRDRSWRLFIERFHAKGDRRLGFYVLLAQFDSAAPTQYERDGEKVRIDPLQEHPGNALAKYLAFHFHAQRRGERAGIGPMPGPKDGFIQRLAAFRDLMRVCDTHHNDKSLDRHDVIARCLNFAADSKDAYHAWAAIYYARQLLIGTVDAEKARRFAELYQKLESHPVFAYTAAYERACFLHDAGDHEAAVKQFESLVRRTSQSGKPVRLDYRFIRTMESPPAKRTSSDAFLVEAAENFVKVGRNDLAVQLALWCDHRMGRRELADAIHAQAIVGAQDLASRARAVLASVVYLANTNRLPRADAVLQGLLIDSEASKSPGLWRLAGYIAQRRNQTAKMLTCLERAIHLEYADLPDLLDLQQVREDFGGLLSMYQSLAKVFSAVESKPSPDFVARVVGVADRWRSLDPDATQACQLAGRTFQALGLHDLAWDYLTTPIGLRPNEAAPWLEMARTMREEGDLALADRAYAAAFDAEATNAQILWDRAQNLDELGQTDDARKVYRVLAEGTWQPRFNWLKEQAKRRLER